MLDIYKPLGPRSPQWTAATIRIDALLHSHRRHVLERGIVVLFALGSVIYFIGGRLAC